MAAVEQWTDLGRTGFRVRVEGYYPVVEIVAEDGGPLTYEQAESALDRLEAIQGDVAWTGGYLSQERLV